MIRRCAASAAALAVFGVLALLYVADESHAVYYDSLKIWGVQPFAFPYLDFSGYMASLQCTRMGIDVIAHDWCDVLDRQFNYGPLWLDLTFLPLYPEHRVVGGAVLGVVFLLCLAALPPPPDRRGVWMMVLAATSTAVVFVVERGNPDAVIFVLLLPVAALLRRGAVAQILGYGLIWFAAGLKFYPLVLLGLTLRARMGRFLLGVGITAGLVGVYIWHYYVPLLRIIPLLPVGNYDSDLFAAKNLPMRMARFTEIALAPGDMAGPAAWLVGLVILVLLLARVAGLMRRWLRNPAFIASLSGMAPALHMPLLSGCLLISGCFFAGQNIAYRAIFLLFALPGLLALGAASAPAVAGLGGRASRVALFLLWEGAIRHGLAMLVAWLSDDAGTRFLAGFGFWVLRELLWWWLVALMLAVIWQFAWASPLRRAVWR